MTAIASDLVAPAPTARVEIVRCQTSWCKAPLGVRKNAGAVYWHAPVTHNYVTGETEIECQICHAKRTWKPRL
jgi:hypothetical protein